MLMVAVVTMSLLSPTAANAASIYDTPASTSLRNLVSAMSMYGLMNGNNYANVTRAALQPWGWTPGANDAVDLWVEGTGSQWRATLRDVRGSAEFSYATTGVFNGLTAGTRGQSSPQPLAPSTVAGVRIYANTNMINETALAAALAASTVSLLELCASTAVIPGPRTGTSSLPNHTVACYAAAGLPGATALSVLRALAGTAAGRAALASIARTFIVRSGGVTTVQTPSWVDVGAPETQVPTAPPVYDDPLGSEWRASSFAAALATANGLTSSQGAVAADQCLKAVAAAMNGDDPYDRCRTTPIFLSGRDVPTATDHDLEALMVNPGWVALNYENKTRVRWYATDPRCVSANMDNHCDEYPFQRTAQGGPTATPPVSLKVINGLDNTTQGGQYGWFINACAVDSRPAKDFLAVPIPPSFVGVPTFHVCNL